jgi:hypothetical protein
MINFIVFVIKKIFYSFICCHLLIICETELNQFSSTIKELLLMLLVIKILLDIPYQ